MDFSSDSRSTSSFKIITSTLLLAVSVPQQCNRKGGNIDLCRTTVSALEDAQWITRKGQSNASFNNNYTKQFVDGVLLCPISQYCLQTKRLSCLEVQPVMAAVESGHRTLRSGILQRHWWAHHKFKQCLAMPLRKLHWFPLTSCTFACSLRLHHTQGGCFTCCANRYRLHRRQLS
jgi:hypothetical protein